ncbi:hypothetical protein BZG73_03165 [Salinivibrio siamensis]|uniref:Uncharacterized protein n=1 Tax=Salinivibrio siamensis TaxID=414286 RepID=A0ABX3KD48_9GAMM|nr:hypothetical protein [Salinivibrio siamensis]OOE86855.1 hypothetical protein BZG73_03165 [Salinivibrio siamensis]
MSSGLHSIENEKVIFYVDTEECGRKYMSASRSSYKGSNYKIVFVDAMKFLALWKNDPGKQEYQLSSGDKSAWESDYKYPAAEYGFSHGLSNPVPLAFPHCQESEYGPYASFSNGITRTIWLLSKGAKSFPLETDNESAQLFVKYAGVGKGIFSAEEYRNLTKS